MFIAALIALLAVASIAYSRTERVQPVVAVVQSFLTVVAILLAGFWYFVERKGTSHAELSVKADGVHLTPDQALVQLKIEIRNAGATLLHADDWKVQILSLDPAALPIAQVAALPYDQWPGDATKGDPYRAQELAWPAIRVFKGREPHQIEPGELDLKTLEFLVPCDEKVVRAAVSLKKRDFKWDPTALLAKRAQDDPAEYWWKARALLDIGQLCGKPVGASTHFEGGEGK